MISKWLLLPQEAYPQAGSSRTERRGNLTDPVSGKVPDSVAWSEKMWTLTTRGQQQEQRLCSEKVCTQWGKPEREDRVVGHIQQEKRGNWRVSHKVK